MIEEPYPTFATRILPNGLVETYRVVEIPIVKTKQGQTAVNSKEDLEERLKNEQC